MRKVKNLLFYITTIGGFSVLMYWIILKGRLLEVSKEITTKEGIRSSSWNQFLETFQHNLSHPLGVLLLQIIAIIIVARIFGYAFKKIGQPSVIGEIVAGIALGPSLMGWLFPEFSAALFPVESLGNLKILSQFGLILFMFVVGMELDLKVLKTKVHEAVVISHASIIFPFALGLGLAYYIYGEFAPPTIGFLSFGLFMGIAMSITAFPVLARIVQERGMSKTRLGSIVITCAAADDITAWCILATVIAIVNAGDIGGSMYIVLIAILYVAFMLVLVQPFLKRIGSIFSSRETLSKPIVAVFFLTLIFSAYVSEVIGIHALFGAFLAGVIMPENLRFRNIFIEKVEDISLVLLLPIFFVLTGLRTEIGLLNEPGLWKICGYIILVAITGKLFGSAITARFIGQSWRDSLIIGTLMNTRGLMELVVLNIGYELGVLSPEIFAMMVIMALATTFMTGPALNLIERFYPEKVENKAISEEFNILLSFGNPETGKAMLRLAAGFNKKSGEASGITVLHLSPVNEVKLYNEDSLEKEIFKPIRMESKKLGIHVSTLYKHSLDFSKEIVETANQMPFSLLLIGMGQSVFQGTFLGKILGATTKIMNPETFMDTISGKEKLFGDYYFDERVKQICKGSNIPVGIFLDKGFHSPENIVIPILVEGDDFLLYYAQKLVRNNDATVTIINSKISAVATNAIETMAALNPDKIKVNLFPETEGMNTQNLAILSISGWKKLIEEESPLLQQLPSLLIIQP
jgi:Kef-type K+ transport system membrane component KefB